VTLTLDLLAERIETERRERVSAQEAVEKARQIQFDEYERRLDILNHSHEQAVEAARATVPREIFDRYVETAAEAIKLAFAAEELKRNQLSEDVRIEREARVRLEGGLAFVRLLLVFLGLPGLVAFAIGVYGLFAP
jgi:hypothetical protein